MRVAIAIGVATLISAAAWAGTAAEDGLGEKLVGTYAYVSGKRGDADVEKAHLAGKVRITKDTIALVGEAGEEEFVIPYKLEPEKDGKAKLSLEITKAVLAEAVGSKAKGLVKLEGDTVTLIYDYEEGSEPDDFEPDGPMQHLFVLKRQGDK